MILLTGATGPARLRGAAAAASRAASRCAAWCATRGGSGPSGCTCSSPPATSPTRPRSATRCAACAPSSTSPAPSATSPGRRSRSSTALATWRLLRAAERGGRRATSLWTMPLGATPHHPSRVHRAKALAAGGGGGGGDPDDHARDLARSTRPATAGWRGWSASRCCPAVPLTGRGAARTQPLWAEDAADGVLAALDRGPDGHARHELAGPGGAHPPRGRRARAARRRPPPAAAARPARRPARRPDAPARCSPARPPSPPGTRR